MMRMIMTTLRSYSELRKIQSFEDRYEYLRIKGSVGRSTFGHDRYLNQRFYSSLQWAQLRDQIILRDNGCDLGVSGFEIYHRILIHHMNPIESDAIINAEEHILDPEFLICTTHKTHNAIHYGDSSQLLVLPKERRRGDTKLW